MLSGLLNWPRRPFAAFPATAFRNCLSGQQFSNTRGNVNPFGGLVKVKVLFLKGQGGALKFYIFNKFSGDAHAAGLTLRKLPVLNVGAAQNFIK